MSSLARLIAQISFYIQYESLSGLVLPGKRTFNNMNKEFLEKRKAGLNAYLQVSYLYGIVLVCYYFIAVLCILLECLDHKSLGIVSKICVPIFMFVMDASIKFGLTYPEILSFIEELHTVDVFSFPEFT